MEVRMVYKLVTLTVTVWRHYTNLSTSKNSKANSKSTFFSLTGVFCCFGVENGVKSEANTIKYKYVQHH